MKKYSIKGTEILATQIDVFFCLEDLNSLITREGCKEVMPFFADDEIVIDMDCVEAKVANELSRNKNRSMDSAFMISDIAGINEEILLVEFRFNYQTGLRNLDRKALLGKVSGSVNILNNIFEIHDNYYFIFDANLKQQAINRLRRMIPAAPSNFIATDIDDLKSIFFNF